MAHNAADNRAMADARRQLDDERPSRRARAGLGYRGAGFRASFASPFAARI